MAQQELKWRNLVPGIVLSAVVLVSVYAVLRFARIGRLHGDTITVYAAANAARGVIKGTNVWLGGQRVGLVKEIIFRPASVDTSRRILMTLEVLVDKHPYIRRDSPAQIRAGGSLIGEQVLSIGVGSVGAPPLQPGDTLQLTPQGDTEGVTSQVALASREFPEIIKNVKLLSAQLSGASGTAGAVLEDGRTAEQFQVLRGRATSIVRRTQRGEGTVALALGGRGDAAARFRAISARVDSIRALVGSTSTSLGRFRKDSTLLREVGDVRNEIALLRALIAEPRGTAGRAVKDKAAQQELSRIGSEMDALFADIKKRPLRYIAF